AYGEMKSDEKMWRSATTLLVIWDLSTLRPEPAPSVKLSPQQLEQCWGKMSQEFPLAAEAMRTMAASPEQALDFLEARLKLPSRMANVPRLLDQLDSDD